MLLRLIILVAVLLLIDLYGWRGLRSLFSLPRLRPYRKLVFRAYWIMDVAFIVFGITWAMIIRNSQWPDYVQYRNYFYITGAFVLIFLPKFTFLVFVILYDIQLLVLRLFRLLTEKTAFYKPFEKNGQRRFLPITGFILSVFMFGWVLYGVAWGRFNFKVEEVEVRIEGLPSSFEGYRLVHFSDTHLGSFARTRPVERGLRKIEELKPDAVMFSGDLVNNQAKEAKKFVPYFRSIQTPDGMFSVLGNHDMGDYRRWYTIEEKEANLLLLELLNEQMGFHLLRNEHAFITRGEDSLMVIGVDNWGLPPFSQYGDLEKALGEYRDFPLQVLISHDPSHWREEVIPDSNIRLTLSGHTHAMQFGFRTPFFKWSPSALIYPEWSGLYRENEQKLYVNRGFGFLGFPGRIGMPPEITLIVLRNAGS